MSDPNGDAKDTGELRLFRATRLSLRQQLERIMDKLGDPPDMSKLDAAFWSAEDKELIRVIEPILERMALEAAEEMLTSVPMGVDWGLIADDAAQWARAYSAALVRGVDGTTRGYVGRKVAEYIETPGATIGDLEKSLTPMFGQSRAQSIAVTETTRAFARGQDLTARQLRAQGLTLEPVWHTNRDELVCPVCGPNDDKPKSAGWTVDEIPAHVNCILPGNKVITPGGVVAAAKSFYVGRAIEVRLANGRILTVTENHPILTERGWIAAQFLTERDKVLYSAAPEGIAAAIDPDNDHMPAMIEQVYSTLKESFGMVAARMPAAAKDLHSDGANVKGDIDIVYSNSLLLNDTEPHSAHVDSQHVFGRGSMATGSFFSERTSMFFAGRDSAASGGGVGVIEHPSPIVGARVGPTNVHTVGHVAGLDIGRYESSAESPAIDTRLASQFLFRFASHVTPEQIVKIRYFDFAGHVYDLQCDLYSLYIASGVVVKNCRCWETHQWQA